MSTWNNKDEDEETSETKEEEKPPPDEHTPMLGQTSDEDDLCVNVSKQDYRLDFTEVEGTLEAVPEEGIAVNNNKTEVVQEESTVPESNASDIYSECSYQTADPYSK